MHNVRDDLFYKNRVFSHFKGLVTSLQSDALSKLVSSVTSKVSFSDEFAKR